MSLVREFNKVDMTSECVDAVERDDGILYMCFLLCRYSHTTQIDFLVSDGECTANLTEGW